jgi:uncharacterized protein (TIGR01777 family)
LEDTASTSVVVQASGVGYYGPRGDEMVVEDDAPGSDFLAGVCVDWEASTRQNGQTWRQVVLRTGVVLARHGGALARLLPVFRLGLGGRLGSGRQWFPWIHLSDQVRAIEHLIDSPVSGPFNLAAPAPVTSGEFVKALGRALGRPVPWVIPAPVLSLMFGEMAITVLAGQRAVPRRLEASGFEFRYPEVESALRSTLRPD